MTFDEIADRDGVSKSTIHKWVKRLLQESTAEDSDLLKHKISKQYAKLLSKAEGMLDDPKLQVAGCNLILKTLEAQRKMFGLDAPVRGGGNNNEINIYGNLSFEVLKERIASRLNGPEVIDVEEVEDD